MRSVTFACGTLLFVAISCSIIRGQEPNRFSQSFPQSAPVIEVLKAVKDSDVAAFNNAYSKRIRDDKDQGYWEKKLKETQAAVKKRFGEFQVKDFEFVFYGSLEEDGRVILIRKGNKAFSLAVIKEGDNWKVDSAELAAEPDYDGE